jgi:predicted nuclease of predicted toxin-antitoxin system
VIRLLVDQNFNSHILEGLLRREAGLDIEHVRDLGLDAATDTTILETAARLGRVLLTHDRRTVPAFAYSRVAAGQPMAGVFLVSDDMPIGQAIDQILIAVHCLSTDECKDIVKFFPL